MDQKETTSGKKRRGRGWLIALLVIFIVLLCIGLLVYGAITLKLNSIKRPDPNETYIGESEWESIVASDEAGNETYESVDPDAVDFASGSIVPIGGTSDLVNILLIGDDRRPGEDRARSDSIILCSINKKTGKISLVSFLRDLYVQIPDYKGDSFRDNRINASYAFGGMELLDQTLEKNFGILIDGNLSIDFDGFEKVIDILGGVDIDLTQEEVDYMHMCNRKFVTLGTNHFDGKTALFYASIRYIGTDFGRTNRQRTVLNAIFHKLKGSSVSQMLELMDEILPLMTTDMSNSQIISYIYELLPIFNGTELQTMYIPYADTYSYSMIRGMSVLLPDYAANRKLLQELLLADE